MHTNARPRHRPGGPRWACMTPSGCQQSAAVDDGAEGSHRKRCQHEFFGAQVRAAVCALLPSRLLSSGVWHSERPAGMRGAERTLCPSLEHGRTYERCSMAQVRRRRSPAPQSPDELTSSIDATTPSDAATWWKCAWHVAPHARSAHAAPARPTLGHGWRPEAPPRHRRPWPGPVWRARGRDGRRRRVPSAVPRERPSVRRHAPRRRDGGARAGGRLGGRSGAALGRRGGR